MNNLIPHACKKDTWFEPYVYSYQTKGNIVLIAPSLMYKSTYFPMMWFKRRVLLLGYHSKYY